MWFECVFAAQSCSHFCNRGIFSVRTTEFLITAGGRGTPVNSASALWSPCPTYSTETQAEEGGGRLLTKMSVLWMIFEGVTFIHEEERGPAVDTNKMIHPKFSFSF